jgi:hypothetical protein
MVVLLLYRIEETYLFSNDVDVPSVHAGCVGPVDPCYILFMLVCFGITVFILDKDGCL